MLILTRKIGESLILGDGIEVKITDVSGDQVRIGIEAPSNVKIYRKELYATIQENKAASHINPSELKDLIRQMK